jgi:hypothetical protein
VKFLHAHLQSAQTVAAAVNGYRWRIEWLLAQGHSFRSILNPGCHIGYETISLLWSLNAENAIGVDIDSGAIQQANSIVEDWRTVIVEMKRGLDGPIEAPFGLRQRVMNFLGHYADHPLPTYMTADITEDIGLPASSYDLAYCHKVLYHLACTEDGTPDWQAVTNGIEQVSALLKTDGLFVAIEPTTCSPETLTPFDLTEAFSGLGLRRAPCAEQAPEIGGMRIYCYSRS